MLKTFFCFLAISLSPLSPPALPNAMLKQYVIDSVGSKLSNEELWGKYFCTTLLGRTDQDGEKTRSILDFWLSQQRNFLRKDQMNLAGVTIAPFDSLAANELPTKPFHMMSETTHTYVARYHGEIILFFLLQDDKIASTLLVNMGGENNFTSFCK